MYHARPTSSVLIVQPNRDQAIKLVSEVRNIYPQSKIGHAIDLSEAYNLAEHAHPDLVILDAEHAATSGLPMFLSLLSALSIDYVAIANKPFASAIPTDKQVKVSALQRHLSALSSPSSYAGAANNPHHGTGQLKSRRPSQTAWKTVVIGASTGGIEALIHLLSHFPEDCPPTLIVQHITAAFLPGMIQRLDRHCPAKVRAAVSGDRLEPGTVLVAPDDNSHLVLDHKCGCRFDKAPPLNGHRPSIDALFLSAAEVRSQNTVGVLLTGMGRDGAAGMSAIRRKGGWTIGQDEATSTVYGMPRAAQEADAVLEELPLPKIATAILKAAKMQKIKEKHG